MAHRHSAHESTLHFTIDPATRTIINTESNKAILIQNDHNSKRFSFELPRMIGGHDMSLCDIIEVHFINISAEDKTQTSSNVYIVDDIEVSSESEETVVFTWLLSGAAAKYVGLLSFCIRFVCVDGGENGDISELPSPGIEYAWHTGIYSNVSVGEGFNFGEVILEEYSDVLSTWNAKLSRKVNTTLYPNMIYGTDERGDAFLYKVEINPEPLLERFSTSIPIRDREGRIKVPRPTEVDHAVPNGYFEEKLQETYLAAKNGMVNSTTQPNILYGTNSEKRAAIYSLKQSATAKSVPQRDENGDLLVLDEPISKNGAVSKSFVERAINDRVSSLESLTLTYTEDATAAYDKLVPTEVGKYALVKSIGGATKKVSSKNLIDPSNITVRYKNDIGTTIPVTIDTNGFITFTVKYEYGLGAAIYIDMPKGEARYYYLIEGDTPSYIYGYGEALEIEFNLPEDADKYGDQLYADEATFTFGIMAFIKEGDTEYGWEVAPEGTVFEPYGSELLHAKVEKIESRGKNLLPSDALIASNWDTKVDRSYYYLDLPDGWYCLSAKLKEGYNANAYVHLYRSIDGGANYTVAESAYGAQGRVISGYMLTGNGLDNSALWFKVDKKAGIIFSLWAYLLTQDKLDWLYDIQIEKVELTQEPSGAYQPGINAPATEYKPYRGIIDSIVIPEAVRNLDGFGLGINNTYYNYLEFKDGKVFYHKVCEELVLNGTEKWGLRWGDDNNFTLDVANITTSTDYTAKFNGICSHYENASHANIYNKSITKGIASIVGAIGVTIRDTDIIGVEAWKAHLAEQYANGTPVTVIYALATEEVTDITHLFTEDNSIEVEQGGPIRFVNEKEIPVPNTIAYVTRKE